jgi:predicted nucleotidyltransferase
MLQSYLAELKIILSELNPYKVVLFGSCACGEPTDDSDIDLIVILNKNELPKSFAERSENYSFVKKYFSLLKDRVPMDLIVYTKREWEEFIKADNSFTKEILKKGKVLV